MTLGLLTPNTLAFIGPVHATELTDFCYVRLVRVSGEHAIVCVAGLDFPTMKAKKFLYPYVAHTVAPARTAHRAVGLWGVVRYEVNSQGASLSVLSGEESVSIQLIKPLQVIKADPITYALQVGGTVSDMILNPKELLHQQNSMIGACRKKRGDLPGSVRTMLSFPSIRMTASPSFGPPTLAWLPSVASTCWTD
ncbi:hypothetical protein GQ600_9614 [Phytophthora cactorum]|nr:hypothetical protein GQ600_9614 [Phytophthora cactorum]